MFVANNFFTRLLIGAIFCTAISVSGVEHASAGEGDKDFELYNLKGALYDLQRVRRSEGFKVVVVDFFEVSCIPCRKALPRWSELFKELAPKGFKMVIVALPGPEDRAIAEQKLTQFFSDNPVPFPVVFDKYKNVAKLYGVVKDGSATLPQAFLINAKGRQIVKGQGPEDLEKKLRDALAAPLK